MIDLIGLDADDTLWHSERDFASTQERFRETLARYADAEAVDAALAAAETRNLGLFGYGVKSFTLSMIEAAVEVSGGRIGGADIQRFVDAAKDMLANPVELIDGAYDVVAELAGTHVVVVITKGDLFHQEAKLASSGLAELVDDVVIVSDKQPRDYQRVVHRAGVDAARFVMVGNSMRSDVLPPIDIGAHGVHVPYEITWSHEHADAPDDDHGRFHRLDKLVELPDLVRELDG